MLLPFVASAETLSDIVTTFVQFVGQFVMPLLFSIALAWFIWVVIDFIRNADSAEERKKGRRRILWGIIVLFVMVAYLGITSVFTTTFFGSDPILPQLWK